MAIEEMKVTLIDQYSDYQEIKLANKEDNHVLDYKIKKVTAKLESLGVNVENLKL